MKLTDEGARYNNQIKVALNQIALATEEIAPCRSRSELRICCAAGLASRWLMRRLPRLAEVLPNIDVALVPIGRKPNFAVNEVDLEISFSDKSFEPDINEEELIFARMFPVASPDFRARNLPLTELSQLPDLVLLHENSREQWRQWLLAAGLQRVPALRGPLFWFTNVAIEAALQGQGIALANSLLVQEDIGSGKLIEVLPIRIPLSPYLLRARSDRWNEPIIARTRAWLKSELALSEIAT